MHRHLHPEEPDLIDCEVCLTQIPADSSANMESEEYVYHFCGIHCYEEWKRRNAAQTAVG